MNQPNDLGFYRLLHDFEPIFLSYKHSFFSEVSKKCCDKNSLSIENKKLHLLQKKLAFLSLSSALCLRRPFIISVYDFFISCTLFGGMNSLFYSCFLVNTVERYLIVVFSKIKVAPLH